MDAKSEIISSKRFKDSSELTGGKPTKEFAEVTIPVPWGHISGKWFGPQNVRPILGLHGWLDNAGTFDTLSPLLPSHIALLSIDLPGHGLSSSLPDGCFYNSSDNLLVILMVMNQYRWEKVSLIGHSMSGILAFVFAAVFPDKVDMIISLDALKPHQRNMENTIVTMANRLESFIKEDQRHRSKVEPPSYSYDELIERLFDGSLQSVKKDRCKYMLARNIQKSDKYPDKYFFCRDRRVMHYNYRIASQDLCVAMAKRITCAHMFIKAQDSIYFEDKKYYDEIIDILLKKDNFVYVQAKGTHHLHLNNPEEISEVVNKFVEEHGPKVEVLSKL